MPKFKNPFKKSKKKKYSFDDMIIGKPTNPKYIRGFDSSKKKYFDTKYRAKQALDKINSMLKKKDYDLLFGKPPFKLPFKNPFKKSKRVRSIEIGNPYNAKLASPNHKLEKYFLNPKLNDYNRVKKVERIKNIEEAKKRTMQYKDKVLRQLRMDAIMGGKLY